MKWQYYFAGAGAGVVTSFIDLVKDPTNGTIARTGGAIRQGIFAGVAHPAVSPLLIAIVAIVAISVFACWVFEVTSRLDGFLRGCTILAAFSLGSPNPILNPQVGQPNPENPLGQEHSEFQIFSNAFAQTAATPASPIGNAYIILTNLKALRYPPQSIVTITDAQSFERISAFQISNYRIEITQRYGTYLVHVDTQGYASIVFTLTINAPILAFDVTAPPSSLPIALQKLLPETQVALISDESELFKQSGREKLLGQDFTGAISDYQHALSINPTDQETNNFLGYALFRSGELTQAEQVLAAVVQKDPSYDIARLNLTKVLCSEHKLQDAKGTFASLKARPVTWRNDVEFLRACQLLVAS
jgi:hypothetical protein